MNILFAEFNQNQVGLGHKTIEDVIRTVYHSKYQRILTNTSGYELGMTKGEGKILGSAKKNEVSLVLHGYLHGPLPGWKGKDKPIDNPDESAAYLLNRYLKYGKQFVKNVWGHYALVVVDGKRAEMCLAKDPYGHTDLYYYKKAGHFVVSTKLSLMANYLGTKTKPDRTYEDFLLIYGYYPHEQTLYQGVKAVAKNTVVVFNGNKLEKLRIKHREWMPAKLLVNLNRGYNEKKITKAVYQTMMKSLTSQLTSEKKVAVLLGGFDSALVAAMLTRLGKTVETFSFYYQDGKYNQPHTDTVAKYLGIKHNWVKITDKIIEKGIKDYHLVFNKPTNWPNYVIQTTHIAKIIKKKGFNYCYSGDGCDYLFYGYPITFKRAKYLRVFGMMPRPLLKLMIRAAERPVLERIFGRPFQVALGILRGAAREETERNYLTFRIFDEMSLKVLRNYKNPHQKYQLEKLISLLAKPHRGLSPLRLAYRGKMELAPYRIKMNGSADLTGLVIAAPYLHVSMQQMALSLPDEYLRPELAKHAIGKYILARMAEDEKLLPRDVIYQEKMGAVDAPLGKWYATSLKSVLEETLLGLPFDYSKAYVKTLLAEKNAELWYGKFISKDTSNIVTLTHCISMLLTYAKLASAVKSPKN